VQVDPIKPTLKAPGIKLLKLKYGKRLTNFGFKFNLRRYNKTRVLFQTSYVKRMMQLNKMDHARGEPIYMAAGRRYRAGPHPQP